MWIDVNAERLVPDPSGALWWPSEATLVFSDLHFEKGSSYARAGALLPPYDTRETLARMVECIDRRQPRRIIALGDSFHDRYADERLDESDRATLRALGSRGEWIWIKGNHDPSPPAWLGGTITAEAAIGGLIFRHEPETGRQQGEIAGHLHPCATVIRRGRALRRRCFVSDGTRIVLPSFGAYTGGLDVREAAVEVLFPSSYLAYVMGARRVYAIATAEGAHRLWRERAGLSLQILPEQHR
jgi:DNA ligase-associated metallophosphoesterase